MNDIAHKITSQQKIYINIHEHRLAGARPTLGCDGVPHVGLLTVLRENRIVPVRW